MNIIYNDYGAINKAPVKPAVSRHTRKRRIYTEPETIDSASDALCHPDSR